jgi:cytochrome c oxidase cbb3-type subunit III
MSLAILCLGSGQGMAPAQETSRTASHSPTAPTRGKQLFSSNCGACHGLDGRGGERAPDIATVSEVQQMSDLKISHIIESGVPGTAMPSFRSLGKPGIKAVVSYLRTLQGKGRVSSLPGDATAGKALFFGTAGCSKCHMAAGVGGFIASDLSAFGRDRAVAELRRAITNPRSDNGSRSRTVIAFTRTGQKYVGVERNHDNFSLQMQTLDGAFHLFSKSELERIEYPPESVMPSDYGSRLTARELDNVVSYLISVASSVKSQSKPEAKGWQATEQ